MTPRRSGLGRGLDALLPGHGDTTILERRGGLDQVPVDLIDPNPRQPRRDFADAEIDELAASIAELGVLQPVLVRPAVGGRHELIAGERRLRAARRAGLSHVPALVVETDEAGSLERALVENVHRSDLNPLEEAAAYRELLEERGLTHEGLAERVGKNRTTITNVLRLLELPGSVQRLLVERRLTVAHAKALLALQGSPFMERLGRRAADEGWSVRETEDAIRKYQALAGATLPSRRGAARDQGAALEEIRRRLADHLQTRVRIETGKKKGKVVLDFASPEELERLAGIILGATEGARSTVVTPR